MRMTLATIGLLGLAFGVPSQNVQRQPSWTVVLHARDFVLGDALQRVHTHHHWISGFNGGRFEVAVRKSAIPIPAPNCGMDYLILTMPAYYPEDPAQATLEQRRSVYDALMRIQETGREGLKVRFDALWYSKKGRSGPELTTCNIYFTLPLESDASTLQP